MKAVFNGFNVTTAVVATDDDADRVAKVFYNMTGSTYRTVDLMEFIKNTAFGSGGEMLATFQNISYGASKLFWQCQITNEEFMSLHEAMREMLLRDGIY